MAKKKHSENKLSLSILPDNESIGESEKRQSEIPLLFDRPWGNSNVSLQCTGSDSLLHVNKATLASFSPVWNALFFSEFAEKDMDIVTIDIHHENMLEILQILHHVKRNFTNKGQILHNPEQLRKLYLDADKYDVPIIRDMVKQQLNEIESCEAYKLTSELNLEDEKKESLKRMERDDVRKLLNGTDLGFLIPLHDVKELMLKFAVEGISVEKKKVRSLSWDGTSDDDDDEPKNAPNTSVTTKKFDVPWATSDAVLRTNDETPQHLHVNKSVLATFSPFFHALFFAEDTKQLQDVVDIDVEYTVMFDILCVLHHVDRKFGRKGRHLYPASVLLKMYVAAEKLEIGVIIELVKQQLPYTQPSEAFEISVQLGLQETRSSVLKKMNRDEINSFLSHNRYSSKMLFSPADMFEVIKRSYSPPLRSPWQSDSDN